MSDPTRNKRKNLLTHEREPAPAKPQPVVEPTALVQEALAHEGQPLDTETRTLIEPQFGHSFGDVRIHADDRAARAADALGALAFATGPNLLFAPGQYAPGTHTGDHLLAHELAHTVQQAHGPVSGTPVGDVLISDPADEHEREADRVADRVVQRVADQRVERPTPSLFRPLHQPSFTPSPPPPPNLLTMFALNRPSVTSDAPDAVQAEGEQGGGQGIQLGFAPLPLMRGGYGGHLSVQRKAPEGVPPDDDEELRRRLQQQAEQNRSPSNDTAAASTTQSSRAAVESKPASTQDLAPGDTHHITDTTDARSGGEEETSRQQMQSDVETQTTPSNTITDTLSDTDAAVSRDATPTQSGEVVPQKSDVQQLPSADVNDKPATEELKEHTSGSLASAKDAATQALGAADDGAATTANKKPTSTVHQVFENAIAANAQVPPTGGNNTTSIGAVAKRDEAASHAQQATTQLAAQANGSQLTSVTVDFAPSGADEVSSTGADADVLVEQEEQRATASSMVNSFVTQVVGRVNTITALGETIPAQVQPLADAVTATILASVEAQIATISTQVAQIRARAETEAQVARDQIIQQHEAAGIAITSATASAREQVEAAHTIGLNALTDCETTQLQRVDALYVQGDVVYRAAGTNVGGEATKIGQDRALVYRSARINRDDSFLDGPLTDDRCEARAEAATKLSEQYKADLIKQANLQAEQAQQRKPQDIHAVRETTRQARATLEIQHIAALNGLTTAEQQALQQAQEAQIGMLQAVDQTLHGVVQTLAQQELSQVQAVREAGEQQRLAVEQAAQGTIASLQDGIAEAAAELSGTAQEIVASLQGTPAPDPAQLGSALSAALAQIDGGVATIQSQMGEGIVSAQQSLDQVQQQSLASLTASGQSAIEGITTTGTGLTTTLADLRQNAADTFARIQQTHTTTTSESASGASRGFEQVTQGIQATFNQINQQLEQGFTQNATGLETALRGALPKLSSDITTQADKAAAEVQPRWKSVAKWVLIIAVVLVVAFVIGPLLVGLGPIATILAGAAIGAASGAIIQIGSNLIDGKKGMAVFDGVVEAVVAGAIGGAIGGVGGLLFKGVSSFVGKMAGDVAFNVIGDIVSKLVLGQPITLEGVLKGALIGLAISVGVQGVTSLKAGSSSRKSGTTDTGDGTSGQSDKSGTTDTGDGTTTTDKSGTTDTGDSTTGQSGKSGTTDTGDGTTTTDKSGTTNTDDAPQQQHEGDGSTPQQQHEGDGSTPNQQQGDGNQQNNQQQGDGSTPNQQQGDGSAPQQQQGEGNTPQQQQGDGSAPQQQQGDGSTPQQQQGDGSTPQQQQGDGNAPNQQQDDGNAPQQQQGEDTSGQPAKEGGTTDTGEGTNAQSGKSTTDTTDEGISGRSAKEGSTNDPGEGTSGQPAKEETTPKPATDPAAEAKAAKAKAELDKSLKDRSLDSDPMFENMDSQTQGKVRNALGSDPMNKVPDVQRAAQQWAQEGAGGNPREFANRYEYAKAKYNAARKAASNGQNPKAAAATAVQPEELTKGLMENIESVRELGPREGLKDLPPSTSPQDIADKVQGLDRIGYETETAEAYHALKHQGELPPVEGSVPSRTGDIVKDYATMAQDTVKNGTVAKAEVVGGGSTQVIIRKTYGSPPTQVDMEAIIYVKPDGTVTMASYGRAKAKL